MTSMEAPRRLSKEGTQQEAEMLQAHLELSDIKEPTAEDYDAALEAIEEFRGLAETDPNPTMKAADIFARLGQRSKFALNVFSAAISSHPEAFMLMNKAFSDHEKAMYQLDSAAEKLRKLKEKAGE